MDMMSIAVAKSMVNNTVEEIKEKFGAPLVSSTSAGMTDQSRVYVYTGNESGFLSGHWYYYNGSMWTDGGVYNAVAVETDTTLSVSGKAADGKAVGDQLSDVMSDLRKSVYVETDNLLDFTEESGWERKDLDGTSLAYTMRTSSKLPITGGSTIYTCLYGLSTDTFGTGFNIRIREYNGSTQVGSDHTMNTIGSTEVKQFTSQSNANGIVVELSTHNWQKTITPAQFKELNPLIYVGTNAEIQYDAIYHHRVVGYKIADERLGSRIDDVEDDLAELASSIPDVSTLVDDVDDLQSLVDSATNQATVVPMVANKYINMGGTRVSMTDGHPAYASDETSYSVGYLACEGGDEFTVSGTGGGVSRLWGFVDSTGTILSVSATNAEASGLVVKAPENSAWFITHSRNPVPTYKGSRTAIDIVKVNSDLDEFKADYYLYTDNLIAFEDPSAWEQKTLDGSVNGYTIRSAQKIPVTGGSTLYTCLYGLSTDVFGTGFNIVFREYNGDTKVGSDHTMNAIGSTEVKNYTIDASTNGIVVELSTHAYNKNITPGLMKEINPLIYVGTNSQIQYTEIYHHREENYKIADKELDEKIEAISTQAAPSMALAGFFPANSSGQYPEINTTAKTFKLYDSTTIIDNRGTNKKYIVLNSTVTYDYSAVAAQSTAIMFTWDVDNDTVKAFTGIATIDYSKYIPLVLFRRDQNVASACCPVYIDGLFCGKIDEAKINQGSLWTNPNVRSINHRGYTVIAPENTLPAFRLSKNYGYECVETDVQFTSDGVAVLLHDASINRTARNSDGTELSSTVNIASITYEQSQTYDFGVYKSSAYTGTKIPTFKQFLIACRRLGLHPYIELKVGTQAQIEGLVDAVALNGMKGKVTWISYDDQRLAWVKAKDAKARLGLLADTYSDALVTTVNGLKTDHNEVFLEITSVSQINATIVSTLITNDIPLETVLNGDYSIVIANPYITGFTSDSTGPARQYMYKLWNEQNT